MRRLPRLRSATRRVGRRLRALRDRLPAPGSSGFRIVAASLIGCAALIGSVGAWRAEEASRRAEDVERHGFDNIASEQRARAEIAAALQTIAYDYLRGRAAKAVAAALTQPARDLYDRGYVDDARQLVLERSAAKALGDSILDRIENDP